MGAFRRVQFSIFLHSLHIGIFFDKLFIFKDSSCSFFQVLQDNSLAKAMLLNMLLFTKCIFGEWQGQGYMVHRDALDNGRKDYKENLDGVYFCM